MHTVMPRHVFTNPDQSVLQCSEIMCGGDFTKMMKFLSAATTTLDNYLNDKPDFPRIFFVINAPFSAMYNYGNDPDRINLKLHFVLTFGLTTGNAYLRVYNGNHNSDLPIGDGLTIWQGKWAR